MNKPPVGDWTYIGEQEFRYRALGYRIQVEKFKKGYWQTLGVFKNEEDALGEIERLRS